MPEPGWGWGADKPIPTKGGQIIPPITILFFELQVRKAVGIVGFKIDLIFI